MCSASDEDDGGDDDDDDMKYTSHIICMLFQCGPVARALENLSQINGHQLITKRTPMGPKFMLTALAYSGQLDSACVCGQPRGVLVGWRSHSTLCWLVAGGWCKVNVIMRCVGLGVLLLARAAYYII